MDLTSQTPPRFLAFVGLGGNLGEVLPRMQSAVAGLDRLPWTRVLCASSVYRTRPVDADGPDYLNAVVALSSALGPLELLHALLALERDHDRTRPYWHAPRTLDLDLLWFGGAVRLSEELTVPHPRMLSRAFVLEPLMELIENGDAPKPDDLVLPPAVQRQDLAREQGILKLKDLRLIK
ncbi:MAG TPA: 2-amino-4-hydroxy-6-hydroxymethyldihydropteridine diphosphokinase [Aquabacterium sp.]|nr:2-amino-4-hydroxy-6-hydroxymethyldihydropteridine diphosphokinase [Aquabacterium sp.]